MEKFSGLISVLLEHSSQRFIDFWNLQLVIALGVLGFSLANPEIISKVRVRLLLSVVFVLIAGFGLFSLSAHRNAQKNYGPFWKPAWQVHQANSSRRKLHISIR